jgi:hypothetical protein
MSTIRGSANYAGLLPIKLSDEPPPIRPTTLENERFPDGRRSLRKRASRALYRFVIAFCSGVAATLAWQWYGDASREMIARSYPQLGWLAARPLSTAQSALGMRGPAAPTAPFDRQQLKASLEAIRQSIDRIIAGHELIMRSIDQIATRVTADHEQMTRNTDQTASGITVGQGEMTRSADQTATNIAAGQKQMAGDIDRTGTDSSQAPSAKASTIESRANRGSLQPTVRLDVKPTDARPPQTSSERGKLVSATSGHDRSSQKQIAGSIDRTAINRSQAPSAKASGITVESRANRASLQTTVRLDAKPIAARPRPTSSERGKLVSAASGHDRSSQKQIAGNVDRTATDSSQAPSAKASGLTVESRANRASLQTTVRLDVKPTEARPTQTSSERGKLVSAASGHDRSCFPSASAALGHHQGASRSWTLNVPGHEGTMCWYASARSRARDHRSEIARRQETIGTTENGPSASPPPYTRPPE